jgi:outer membrane protein assembly factor BamB
MTRILVPFLSLFLLGCASSSTVVEHGQVSSTMSTFAGRADALRSGAPSPATVLPLDIADVDDITIIPGRGILVATTGMLTSDMGLYRGPLVMTDQGCRQVLWSYERPRALETECSVILTEPVILLRLAESGKSRYIALDPTSGTELWNQKGPKAGTFILNEERTVLVLASSDDGTIELQAFDVRSGNERWSLTLEEAGSGDQVPSLFWRGNQLTVIGATAFGVQDGSVKWTCKGIGPLPDRSFPVASEDGLLIPSVSGVITRLSNEGKTGWQISADTTIGILTATNECVYFQHTAGPGKEFLRCLDLATGKPLWTTPLPGALRSQILVTEDHLIVTALVPTGGTRLVMLNPHSGAERATAIIPGSAGESEITLPDYLVVNAQAVIVLREGGVGAFRLSDARCLWYHNVPGERLTYAKVLEHASGRMSTVGRQSSLYLTSLQSSACSPVGAALRHQEFVYQTTQKVLDSRSSTRREREAAHEQRIGAINQVIAAERAHQAAERTQAALALGSSIAQLGLSVAEGIQEARKQQIAQGALARVRIVQKMHNRLLNGRYFVRPFGLEDIGNGILVVDTDDGSWFEIMVNPTGRIHSFVLLNCPVATISEDQQHVVVSGAGFDTTQWKAVFDYFNVLRYPAVSLLSFDLHKQNFSPASTFGPQHSYGYIDPRGSVAISPVFQKAGDFSEGYAAVMENGLWGYIDRSARRVVAPQYDAVLNVSEGLGMVKAKGLWGAVDMHGVIVIPPRYKSAKRFSEGLAPVKLNGKWGYVDRKGRMVVDPEYVYAGGFHDGRGLVGKDGKFGFVARTGKIAIPLEYDDAIEFSEGLAATKHSDDWGFIDTSGNSVISESFRAVGGFHSGRALYQKVEIMWLTIVTGFIDREGEKVIDPDYQNVTPFHEGFAGVEKDLRCGYIRADGSIAVPIELSPGEQGIGMYPRELNWMHEGRARTSHYGLFGYIDTTGAVVIPPRFVEASNFSEGLAAVRFIPGTDMKREQTVLQGIPKVQRNAR